jgi:hypothetical protein
MIGSVNSNTAQLAYAQGASSARTLQAPKPEVNETNTGEKNESASTQLREPEGSQAAASLLKTLNASETQNLPPAASQVDANTQASRVSGLKAYNEVGKSQFNFA